MRCLTNFGVLPRMTRFLSFAEHAKRRVLICILAFLRYARASTA